MTNITDTAFLNFLASKGVAPDEYGGFDGPTKLGLIQVFEKQQQPVQHGNYLHPVNLLSYLHRIFAISVFYLPVIFLI